MKTSIQISDALFLRARELARAEKTTLRQLVEEGLRKVVEERGRARVFRLRDASFGGEGVSPGLEEGHWETIRGLIYHGRGG